MRPMTSNDHLIPVQVHRIDNPCHKYARFARAGGGGQRSRKAKHE